MGNNNSSHTVKDFSLPFLVEHIGRFDAKTKKLISTFNPYYIPNLTADEFEKICKENKYNPIVFRNGTKNKEFILSFVKEDKIGNLILLCLSLRTSPNKRTAI